MPAQPDRLKLGKGASFFVKSQLKRLRQEDETWEADFFPIPCSECEYSSVWWGIILSHGHDNVLAQRMVEEPPTVNDLANLLAGAFPCSVHAGTRRSSPVPSTCDRGGLMGRFAFNCNGMFGDAQCQS